MIAGTSSGGYYGIRIMFTAHKLKHNVHHVHVLWNMKNVLACMYLSLTFCSTRPVFPDPLTQQHTPMRLHKSSEYKCVAALLAPSA